MKTICTLVAAGLMLLPVLAAARPQQSRHLLAHGKGHAAPYAYARVSRPGRLSSWRGADPSYGPGTAAYRWYQAHGRCVIDEGYGRYSFCDKF
jgi:hypothetical protein